MIIYIIYILVAASLGNLFGQMHDPFLRIIMGGALLTFAAMGIIYRRVTT